MTDALEQQGMEALVHRHLNTAGTDVDLRAQLVLYEVGHTGKEREGKIPQSPIHLHEPLPGPHIWAYLNQSALRMEDGDTEEATASIPSGGRRERRKPSSEEGKRSRRSLEGGGGLVRSPESG